MWKLIKAEFTYYKTIMIMTHIIIFPILIAYVFFGGRAKGHLLPDKWHVMAIWMVFFAALIAGGWALNDRLNQKRIRFYTLLPLSPGRLAIVRFALPVTVWSSLIFLYWIFYFMGSTGRIESHLLWHILYMTGLFFVIMVIRDLYNDLKYFLYGRRPTFMLGAAAFVIIQIIFWSYFLTTYSYYGVLPFGALRKFVPTFLLSSFTAFISVFIGFGVAVCSIVLFRRRKSFLE